MKLLIGSYDKNIYELIIENNKLKIINEFTNINKPSYLINDNPLSYIFNINNLGYASINNKEILLEDTSCHISYDYKNNRHYVSHYGAGSLSVINKDLLVSKIKYQNNSHIHYASYINTINKIGVVDLGDNIFYLYNNDLTINTSYKFNENYGPRHFVYSKNYIYIITEHIPSIFILKYENDNLILVDNYLLEKGSGSAIRIDSNNQFLYAAVRNSNLLYSFKILNNNNLELIDKTSTYGDHPRDFNISINNNYLVVANMNSSNLSLFEIKKGKLLLLEKDFPLNKGASVVFKNS